MGQLKIAGSNIPHYFKYVNEIQMELVQSPRSQFSGKCIKNS